MAKAKKTKNYEFSTADGKFNFKVLNPQGTNAYSISGAYPVVQQTETGVRKLTRKETINWCISIAVSSGRME